MSAAAGANLDGWLELVVAGLWRPVLDLEVAAPAGVRCPAAGLLVTSPVLLGKLWGGQTMDQDMRMRLEQEYARYSDESLLEAAELGRDEFQEGVYEIILAEIRRRGLQEQVEERRQLKEEQRETEESGGELVMLRRFSFGHEAELAKAVLEEEGIETVIVSDDLGTVPPGISVGTGSAKLLVFEDDLERAEEILDSMGDN